MRQPPTTAWILLAALALSAVLAAVFSAAPRPTQAHERHAESVPVLSPAEAMARFKIQPGFEVQLVAAEPLVESPVAAAFDEFGRLWVVEMRTFMPNAEGAGELEPRNQVVILEDTNHDGVMDTSTVFLDKLILPRAVAPCHGGALVVEPPHLLFCKDTDGDGRADTREVLLDGFAGLDSPEHAGNGLIYGIDNWWELSQHPVRVRFDGKSLTTQKTPTIGQWGITRDDAGRLYYTPNSNPLLMDLFPKQYAARAGGGSATGLGELIGHDGTTWPAIPTPTVNRGYREGTLRADGTLISVTAACGPAIFRTPSWGPEFQNNAFICEPAGQLVKRLLIAPKNDTFDATNAYTGDEFLRSTDERFRPVNSLVGPDGNLYILDMYRGLIQHRMFLTPHLKEITKARGMEAPTDRGRIWRVVKHRPTLEELGLASVQPKKPRRKLDADGRPLLPGTMTTSDLMYTLADPDGWWRDTAQRLLVEHQPLDDAWMIRKLAFSSPDEIPALHALWTLDALGQITPDDIAALAASDKPRLRIAALQLSEHLPDSPELHAIIRTALDDADLPVRVQAALTGGGLPLEPRLELAVAALNAHASDRLIRAAVRTGISGHELDLLNHLLADPSWPGDNQARTTLRDLADAVLAGSDTSRSQLAEAAASLVTHDDARGQLLLDRFKSKLRLDSDEPSPLKLHAEPVAWLAASTSGSSGAELMRQCAVYFEWPGHDVPRRKRIVRDLSPAEMDLFLAGKKLFATTCAVCHQPDGKGSPGLAPALAGSSIASGPGVRMIRVALHGLEGGYMPGGGSWGVMPPPAIKDSGDLAAILTYARRSWGNTGDPVLPAMVAKVKEQTKGRNQPWSRDELNGIKE